MSWRSASTSTSRPASRTASLVTGPIETMRARRREAFAERLGQVADGRGGGEGDVVGGLGGLDRPGARAPRDRLVEGDDVDLGAALAQRVGEDVAGLGGAGDQDPLALDVDLGQRLDQRLGDEALGDDVGAMPRRRERRAVPGPIAATVAPAQARRGVVIAPASSAQRLEEQAHPVGAGQADQGVVADRARPRRAPRRCRSAARSGSPAARPPRRRGCAGSLARPLAWARARVTTTRRPCRGRRSSQASDSRRATTGPTTIRAGALTCSRSTASASVPSVATDGALARPRAAFDRRRGLVGVAAGGDQRRRVVAEPLDAHVEDECAGEAGERLPVERRLCPSRGPRGR